MAFPTDLEIEVAFNNDIDETDYAQSGWTSILPFVASFEGDLRGRSYELDRAEAGTVSLTLDNGDGRFLPGSVQSPYYPYVKSDRRLRIRGKNMVHPNVARGGSRDRNMTGFVTDVPQAVGVSAGSTYYADVYAFDTVRVITASAEPFAAVGEGKEKANDGLSTTKWNTNTTTGWLTYKYAISLRMKRYRITSANDNPTRDPANWTLQGSNNGTTWTTLHTVTGNTWTDRYETQEFTITSPGFYSYYKLDITANSGSPDRLQLAEFDLLYDDAAVDLPLIDYDLTHFVEVTVPASQTPTGQWHRTIAWFVPVEYGVRLSHSAYVWRVSGTEPTGLKVRTELFYYDTDWNEVNSSYFPNWTFASIPTTTTPTQTGIAHAPPADAKYGLVALSIFIPSPTNTVDLVYGVTGIQSELPTNLAPDISGFRDQFQWLLEGDGDGDYYNVGTDPTTSYMEVEWGLNDVNVNTTIPHLIPGDTYTATCEAKILTGQPNVLFSGDEGQTGALINSTTFAQKTITFVASQAEQQLQWILQGTPTNAPGLQIRKLRVERGTPTLTLPTSATQAENTGWLRPKDIFEGWVESWPAVAGSTEMRVTAVDRMKRIGEIDLTNTLRETLLKDDPALLMPLSDSMLDTPGRFSQLGYWGSLAGLSYVDIKYTRGDLGTSSYTTSTDDGPTGEASWKNNPQSSSVNGVGYLFAVPYTRDYVPPVLQGPISKPQPKPPSTKPKPNTSPKQTYTKKWYATWSRSYEGDDSTRFDDTPYMYQGSYDSSSPGNQKSLAGFDYKNIMQTLKGAEILEVSITIKNDHARWNKGLYAFVGSHNYSSKPSTWNWSTVKERRWKKWVTEDDSVTISAGVTFGKELQSGSQKGISIGSEPNNDHDNYGYFRGATQSGKPFITIKYKK
jgi:F5/8 type C domain-containing protein